MKRLFSGFSSGKHSMSQLPSAFFSDLLPLIDDVGELKVTLFCFWALSQKGGNNPYLAKADFLASESLLEGLAILDRERDAEALLEEALANCVARGTLLPVDVDLNQQKQCLYFLNTSKGRRAVKQIQAGKWQSSGQDLLEILPDRPPVFKVYEENIGLLTPLLTERIKDAQKDFPEAWLYEAIGIAVDNNKRSWAYIQKILDRWKQEGKGNEVSKGNRQSDEEGYDYGEYAAFINRGIQNGD